MLFIIQYWKELISVFVITILTLTITGLLLKNSSQKNIILEKEQDIILLQNSVKLHQVAIASNLKTISSLNEDIINLNKTINDSNDISNGTVSQLKKVIKELGNKPPKYSTIYKDCNVSQESNLTQEGQDDFIQNTIQNIGKF